MATTNTPPRTPLETEIAMAIEHEIPHPEHAQEIVFEGCGVLAIAPEEYERAHSLLTRAADALARLTERNRALEAALRPFAAYACDEPHLDEPECYNCRARTLTNGGPDA